MILALTLLAQVAVAEPVPEASDEITVTARLARIRMALGRDAKGKVFCRLNQSSGDPKIDDAVCREASKCVGRKPVPQEAMNQCLDGRKAALVKRWTQGKGQAL